MSEDWNKELEDLAAKVVEELTPFVLKRRDFNRGQSVPDFALVENGREVGALEVTRVVQQETLNLWAGLNKHGKVHVDGSQRLWVVWLASDAVSVRRLTSTLPGLLREIELRARPHQEEVVLDQNDSYGHSPEFDDLRERLRTARIRRCSGIRADPESSRGDVILLPRSRIGTLHPGLVTRDAEIALGAADNRFKCSLRPADGRGELFAWLIETPGEMAMTLPRHSMVGTDADAPVLPPEVTRIWVAAPPNVGEAAPRAVWSSNGGAWESHPVPALG